MRWPKTILLSAMLFFGALTAVFFTTINFGAVRIIQLWSTFDLSVCLRLGSLYIDLCLPALGAHD